MGGYVIPAFWDVPFYVCNKALQLYDYTMDIILNIHKTTATRDDNGAVRATKAILLIPKDKFLYMTWRFHQTFLKVCRLQCLIWDLQWLSNIS